MKQIALSCVCVAMLAAQLEADIYLEITPAGQSPDGLESAVDVGDSSIFDVWISGDLIDTQLFNIRFDLGAETAGDWVVTSIGMTDPDGVGTANPTGNLNGMLIDGTIQDALFTEHPFAWLDQGPWRLYSDFSAHGLTEGGRLGLQVDLLHSSSNGAGAVHVFGVVAIPEPSGSVGILGLALIMLAKLWRV